MLPQLLVAFVLLVCACNVAAVRIGVSRDDANNSTTTTTTTATTTILGSSTLMAESTADDDMDTTTTTTTASAVDLDASSMQPITKFRDFAVPTLPTKITTSTTTKPTFTPPTAKKKTKTYIRTTPTPTTISATVAVTTAETLPLANATPTAATAAARTTSAALYCACDLHARECDVNCCCDADCPSAAVSVFDCHALPMYPELRKRLEDFEYQHGLPSCQVNDGWLCVFRSNTANAAQQQRERQRQLAAMHAQHDTAHNYKWPSAVPELSLLDVDASAEHMNFYKYGDELRVWHARAQQQQTLELPAAFGMSPLCHIKSAVRHLRAERRLCWLPTRAALQQQQRELLAMLEATAVLPQPHVPLDEAAHLALKWQLQLCVDGDCKPLLLVNDSTNDLHNFQAARIVLQLQHNYTHINAATLLLHARIDEMPQNQTKQQQQPSLFWQIYETQFTLNESRPHATHYSGPLGYLQGEPVIVARVKTPASASSLSSSTNVTEPANQWQLDYFATANTTTTATPQNPHTLHLFGIRMGRCYKEPSANINNRFAIGYGISTQKSCQMHLPDALTTNSSNGDGNNNNNYTHICTELQRTAWSLLFDEHITLEQLLAEPLFISQFGRPQNRSDAWLPLHLLSDETHGVTVPAITGVYNAHTQTFVCHNVLLSVAYELQIGTFTFNGHRQQQLITHAALRLGARLDLEFELSERLVVPLTATVMYYDHTTSDPVSDVASVMHSTYMLIISLSLLVCAYIHT